MILNTEIIRIDPFNIERDKLSKAALALRCGGLVAFPTETVYGLGANALDEQAVAGIFRAKNRPADNPLIVHITDRQKIHELTSRLPECAGAIMDAFWPGPLTLIVPRSEIVPDIVTAGLDTVAVRYPSHPVAAALIEMSGVPVAAPSTNTSGRPSPTKAEHVIEDLYGKVDYIIDSGSVEVGLESTVLDITVIPPSILRPGMVTREQLASIAGTVNMDPALLSREASGMKPKAPGMKYRHYAPKAKVVVVEGEPGSVVEYINGISCEQSENGLKIGILATDETKELYTCGRVISLGSRNQPGRIAASLFDALRSFDATDIQLIYAEAVDGKGIGAAIMNRLNKAAGYNRICV
jgi:L-threonylcarbamoyladenylate synthase